MDRVTEQTGSNVYVKKHNAILRLCMNEEEANNWQITAEKHPEVIFCYSKDYLGDDANNRLCLAVAFCSLF